MGLDISSLIGGSIGDAFAKIVGVFKADPNKVLDSQTELTKIQLDLQAQLISQIGSQIDVDKIEAANPHMFVAGWRPFVGWVCGVAVAFHFVISPLGTWITALCGHPVQFPVLDMKSLLGLLSSMLGFGGLRTFEKLQGVATNKLS